MTDRRDEIDSSGALRVLLAGVIDYAGLFPPASLGMRNAVQNFAGYRQGDDVWALGRFVVPVSRLAEFKEASVVVLPGDGADDIPDEVWFLGELPLDGLQSPSALAFSDASLTPATQPWRVSALIGTSATDDATRIREFNVRRAHRTRIDAVEARASTLEEIERLGGVFGDDIRLYVEIPVGDDVASLARGIREIGARAKIRTGGVTSDAYPDAGAVLRFLLACRDAGIACKATAGLHHPLRAEYPLTYERGSARGTMFGFLNVIVAAAFVHHHLDESEIVALLDERDLGAFTFGEDMIQWRGHSLSVSQLSTARELAFDAFGSCSFREPIDDLVALSLL